MALNPAADELDQILSSSKTHAKVHPEDRHNKLRDGRFESSALDSDSGSESQDDKRGQASKPSANPQSAAGPGDNYILPRSQFNGNTGVKGVIADARDFDRARRQERDLRKTEGGLSTLSVKPDAREKRGSSKGRRHEPETFDSDSDVNAEEEDEFMARWRNARLKTIVSYPERSASNVRNPGLTAVDAEMYLATVDSSPAHLTVVVLIHNPDSDDSIDVAEALDDLASNWRGKQRFIMLGHEDAEMGAEGVPALLVYRNGELIDTLVRVQDIIANSGGKGSMTNKLQAVLRSHNVIE